MQMRVHCTFFHLCSILLLVFLLFTYYYTLSPSSVENLIYGFWFQLEFKLNLKFFIENDKFNVSACVEYFYTLKKGQYSTGKSTLKSMLGPWFIQTFIYLLISGIFIAIFSIFCLYFVYRSFRKVVATLNRNVARNRNGVTAKSGHNFTKCFSGHNISVRGHISIQCGHNFSKWSVR